MPPTDQRLSATNYPSQITPPTAPHSNKTHASTPIYPSLILPNKYQHAYLKPSPPNHPLTLNPHPLHNPLVPIPSLSPIVHLPKRREIPPAVRDGGVTAGAEERRCRTVGDGERAGHESPVCRCGCQQLWFSFVVFAAEKEWAGDSVVIGKERVCVVLHPQSLLPFFFFFFFFLRAYGGRERAVKKRKKKKKKSIAKYPLVTLRTSVSKAAQTPRTDWCPLTAGSWL